VPRTTYISLSVVSKQLPTHYTTRLFVELAEDLDTYAERNQRRRKREGKQAPFTHKEAKYMMV